MAVNFYLDKRLDKRGDASIRLSITIAGSRLLTTTGQKISPKKWQAAKQRVRHGVSNGVGLPYHAINALLANIEDFFRRYEVECTANNKRPSTADLRSLFAINFRGGVTEQEHIDTFWDVYDKFTKEVGEANQWTHATYEKFAALRNHLLTFNPAATFDTFDDAGLHKFVAFLRERRELKNSTIGKQIGFFKTFLRWGLAKGFHDNRAYQTFSPKLKIAARKVIYLEWEELMRLYKYKMPADGKVVMLTSAAGVEYTKVMRASASTALTRDIFCFCCVTSLRYSDAINLKWSDISDNTFTITTIKTADTITIELNKYAREILSRYADRHDTAGHVFPYIANQRMNMYLKDLCELCGINQPITQTYYRGSERIEETRPKYELVGTHCGRRTFICNALSLGIPAEIVMKWTGHADYKSMRPYVDIIDKAKAKAMRLFDDL